MYPKLVLEKVSQQATTRMLEFGLSPRHVFEDGATLLHKFCRLPLKDDSAFYLEALIDGGADINKVDKAGHSALFYAL